MKTFIIKYESNSEILENLVESDSQGNARTAFSKANPSCKIREVKEYTGESLLENINS